MNAAAERFLNCVIKRNESDLFVSVTVLVLVILGSPSYIILSMLRFQIETGYYYDIGHYYTVILFMTMAAAFILFMIARSLNMHVIRDIDWMDSLTEYAESKGKDTGPLSGIGSGITASKTESCYFITVILAVVFLLLNTILAIWYAISWYLDFDLRNA